MGLCTSVHTTEDVVVRVNFSAQSKIVLEGTYIVFSSIIRFSLENIKNLPIVHVSDAVVELHNRRLE